MFAEVLGDENVQGIFTATPKPDRTTKFISDENSAPSNEQLPANHQRTLISKDVLKPKNPNVENAKPVVSKSKLKTMPETRTERPKKDFLKKGTILNRYNIPTNPSDPSRPKRKTWETQQNQLKKPKTNRSTSMSLPSERSSVFKEEVLKLQQQIEEKQSQFEQAQSEIKSSMTKQLYLQQTTFDKDRQSFEATSERLQTELKVAFQKIGLMEGHISAKQSSLDEAMHKLQSATSENVKLHDQISLLKTDIVTLNDAVVHNPLIEQVAALQQDMKEAQTREALLRETNEKLSQNLADYVAEIAAMREQVRAGEALRRKMHNTIQELKGCIRVVCRIRPAASDMKATSLAAVTRDIDTNAHEMKCSRGGVNYLGLPAHSLEITTAKELSFDGRSEASKVYDYKFDQVFAETSDQSALFEDVSELVTSSLDGYNVTVFAYGQTGSGKTHTMFGPPNALEAKCEVDMEARGIIPRTVDQLFANINNASEEWDFSVKASVLEIYNEEIRDLLVAKPATAPKSTASASASSTATKGKLAVIIKDGKTVVSGIQMVDVASPTEVHTLLNTAIENKSVGCTQANSRSSRSHTVFQLFLEGKQKSAGGRVSSILRLVDLAGSERIDAAQTESGSLARKEAQCINTSLSALVGCVSAISKKQAHIPFRDSTLTHLLKDSLGGNAKTMFFINVAPEPMHLKETLCTLNFAQKLTQVELSYRGTNTR